MLLEIVTPLHKATQRDYLARMNDDKVHCMGVAKKYGKDYWDGDRRYGYGGYKYIPGRWKPVAQKLIERHGIHANGRPRILDVGCGKGFLLTEFSMVVPHAELVGFDISEEGLVCATPGIAVFRHDASKPFPFDDKHFDLVISLGCLHNLLNYEREAAIKEIERVGQRKFIMLESYRNDRELFNLECWALTCAAFQRPDEWIYEYRRLGYTGDYEFIYFE